MKEKELEPVQLKTASFPLCSLWLILWNHKGQEEHKELRPSDDALSVLL